VVGPPYNENLKLVSCNLILNLHISKKLAARTEFFSWNLCESERNWKERETTVPLEFTEMRSLYAKFQVKKSVWAANIFEICKLRVKFQLTSFRLSLHDGLTT